MCLWTIMDNSPIYTIPQAKSFSNRTNVSRTQLGLILALGTLFTLNVQSKKHTHTKTKTKKNNQTGTLSNTSKYPPHFQNVYITSKAPELKEKKNHCNSQKLQ